MCLTRLHVIIAFLQFQEFSILRQLDNVFFNLTVILLTVQFDFFDIRTKSTSYWRENLLGKRLKRSRFSLNVMRNRF